jgi:hypothetical protein
VWQQTNKFKHNKRESGTAGQIGHHTFHQREFTMPTNLNVDLDTSITPSSLDVIDLNGLNVFSQSQTAHTITWTLSGNASTGEFVSLTNPEPGFAWVGTAPPSGIFSGPTLNANGNVITITDLNNAASTRGTWVYILRATIGGVQYQTIDTTPKGTTTNPWIRNT